MNCVDVKSLCKGFMCIHSSLHQFGYQQGQMLRCSPGSLLWQQHQQSPVRSRHVAADQQLLQHILQTQMLICSFTHLSAVQKRSWPACPAAISARTCCTSQCAGDTGPGEHSPLKTLLDGSPARPTTWSHVRRHRFEGTACHKGTHVSVWCSVGNPIQARNELQTQVRD